MLYPILREKSVSLPYFEGSNPILSLFLGIKSMLYPILRDQIDALPYFWGYFPILSLFLGIKCYLLPIFGDQIPDFRVKEWKQASQFLPTQQARKKGKTKLKIP